MTKQNTNQKQVLQKKAMLDNARIQLKKEFFGIDNIIDEIIDATSSWFMFPNLQDKPVIVNLWGLTGVGKTALIKRLSELLSFEKKFFRFDLGDGERDWSVKRTLEDIYDNVNGYPIIIAMDEFQYAKTKNEDGDEIEKPSSRIVWELLDSGTFNVTRFAGHDLDELFNLTQRLSDLLARGVIAKKGKVVSRKKFFVTEMDIEPVSNIRYVNGKKTGDVNFLPEYYQKIILNLATEMFSSVYDVRSKFDKLNGDETIRFLKEIFEFSISPKTVDCTRALIFVLGNLDEAYKMSDDFSPDMSADEFHRQCLKININHIKNALKRRFRSEQIARLGNIHIIYPALNSKAFKKIISNELRKIHEKVLAQHGISLRFSKKLHDVIYSEGVYPAQGTRPLFTTIHQVITSKLGRVISEIFLKKLKAKDVKINIKNSMMEVSYVENGKTIHSYSEKAVLNLERLRKNTKDDNQAIVAVHESGHAVTSLILLKTVPDFIYSITAETEIGGFVYARYKWKYIAKNQILNRLAMFLGGYAAEKIVFGDEYLTAGAECDIATATGFVIDLLKNSGMGKQVGQFHVKHFMSNDYLHDVGNEINEEAKQMINKALELAELTIKSQSELLLHMADYLSDNQKMDKQMALAMVKKHAKNFSERDVIENGDHYYYRNHLKKIVNCLPIKNVSLTEGLINTREFSLNHKSNEGH